MKRVFSSMILPIFNSTKYKNMYKNLQFVYFWNTKYIKINICSCIFNTNTKKPNIYY